MKTVWIFPFILMALDVGAAAVYLANGDPKRAIYWVAAAVLTLTVTI